MSLIIEGAVMPKSCGGCKASGTDVCKVWMKSKDLSARHPDCPLREFVICKECRFNAGDSKCLNPDSFFLVPPDDGYCSFGKRKVDDGRKNNNGTGSAEMA